MVKNKDQQQRIFVFISSFRRLLQVNFYALLSMLCITSFASQNHDSTATTSTSTEPVYGVETSQKEVNFELSDLNIDSFKHSEYRYRLQGEIESHWVALNSNTSLSITDLPAGQHKLIVEKQDSENNWKLHLILPISVLTPWYSTWQAYFSYFICSLLALLTIIHQQQIRSKRQQSHDQRLHKLAYSDSLTGLPNRQSFYDTLDKFLMLAKRSNQKAVVMFIDLDRFKRINDTLGHDYGDLVLQEVANRLKKSIRESDLIGRNLEAYSGINEIARLGGDEFTLFLSQIDSLEQTTIVTKRVIDSLSKPIKLEQYEVTVTPSIGIAVYPDNGTNVHELMKNADIAMYQAKDDGRRTFKYYSNTLNDRALERLQIEEYMRTAVENQEFQLVFQPQVDLLQNKVTKAEALVRWSQPKLGYVSPADFIPIAEESGLIIELGDWILHAACKQAKQWLDEGINEFKISVNVSSVQFKQTAFIETVRSAINKSQLPPHLLELELTESAVMSDVEDNIERLAQFKEMGISIAIDDFGTGYSSLSYLKQFPIDTLKIDRSFVDEIDTDENDMAIVKTVMVLAEIMQLKVVAEGIETIDQLKILNDFGCQFVQGFYFSKPLKNEELLNFVRRGYYDNKAMWKLALIGT